MGAQILIEGRRRPSVGGFPGRHPSSPRFAAARVVATVYPRGWFHRDRRSSDRAGGPRQHRASSLRLHQTRGASWSPSDRPWAHRLSRTYPRQDHRSRVWSRPAWCRSSGLGGERDGDHQRHREDSNTEAGQRVPRGEREGEQEYRGTDADHHQDRLGDRELMSTEHIDATVMRGSYATDRRERVAVRNRRQDDLGDEEARGEHDRGQKSQHGPSHDRASVPLGPTPRRNSLKAPIPTSTNPAGTKMNVVSQMARPTPIAKAPRTSHGQATLTPEDNRG